MVHLSTPNARTTAVDVSSRVGRIWTCAGIGASLGAIFLMDRGTGAAPVQHLYYLPIVCAAIMMGRLAGPAVALTAVVLYHVGNPALMRGGHHEADFLQIGLFLATGAIATKLVDDARRLRRLAIADDLTGLYNLRGFQQQLTPAVRDARHRGAFLALLVLDVDRLKSLNDAHGHATGADAVRLVGRTLAQRLPVEAVPCRFGGDEFVVALPGYDRARAREVADSLRNAVHEVAPVLAGVLFPPATLSISIGVACAAFHQDRPEGTSLPSDNVLAGEVLFQMADRALYAAKGEGRNRVSAA